MAVYARSSSPQHHPQQHGRSSTNTLMATLPDVMVDFARQMSITSDAEIAAALEQQVHHQHQARCRRILDRRHSLAAMAPQQSNRSAEAPERMARLSVTRPSTARSSSATGCRSAEHLLLLSPTAARSRSPTGGRTSTTPAVQPTPQASSQRLSVTTITTGKTNVTPQHHHGRSQSVRTPKRPSTATSSSSQQHHSNYPGSSSTSGAPPGRPRGTSLPSHRVGNQQYNKQEVDQEEEADYYLLRHFIVQQGSNRVVNRGDSFRQRADANRSTWMVPPRPAGSQHSSASSISTENVAGSPPQSYHQPYSDTSHQSSSSSRRASLLNHDQNLIQSSGGGPEPLRVLMLGTSGVGKTALTAQFMTSEYLNTYEASLDDGTCDRSVSVLLDGEESQLVFIDHPHGEISVENCMSTYNPHAYVIVYSVVDGESLHRAEEILHFLWRHLAERSRSAAFNSILTSPPVILVANKIDLVRSRIVSTQAGKSLAVSFDCKYIETSSGMQHNVDELLVGILKQIRLKMMAVSQQTEAGEGTSSTSSVRSLFRKRSAGRHHRQQNNLNPADPAAVDGLHPNSAANNNLGRRSTSLRVRRMLGKVWPNCADYYQNKSRSCEDLHVL